MIKGLRLCTPSSFPRKKQISDQELPTRLSDKTFCIGFGSGDGALIANCVEERMKYAKHGSACALQNPSWDS